MMNRRYTLLFAAAIATACSASPAKPSTPATEGFSLRGEGRSIPELRELTFLEQAPAAEPAGEQGDTHAYRIGDLRVVHKRTPANAVVQARVYVLGGAANLTPQTAGIEKLAMRLAVTGGTDTTPKDDFNAKLDATGAAIFSFTDRDYSGYGLKTLTDHFDGNWELFTQAVLQPQMPSEEVKVRRTKQLADIASMLETPDSQVSYLVGQSLFEHHPYQQLQIGKKENVESFTRDELLGYQRAMLVPANMLVVIVGNISTDDVLEKVRSSFGRLGPISASPIELPELTSLPGVKFEARDLPTNYILGMFPAPALADPDYPAMLVATDYLRERLFEEIRTKRNLTYAVSSGMADQRTNYGYLYVTAVDPETTMKVMFDEVSALRTGTISKQALVETVNVFITEHYKGLETNGSQAADLAAAELVGGDWRLAGQLLKRIRAVEPEDIQRVAALYLKDYRFAVVGPRIDIAPSLFEGTK